MNPKSYKVMQCDGTVKVYNGKPWWMDEPMSKQDYRTHKQKTTKADKIKAAMSKVAEYKRALIPQIKGDKGIWIPGGGDDLRIKIRNVVYES